MPLTISRPYTFVKDGVFYFSRRIPSDLKRHYSSPRIAYSLRTKSPVVAESRARRAADQLDEYWYHLRCRESELPGKHLLTQNVVSRSANSQQTDESSFVLLSEAVEIYLNLKGNGRPKTFRTSAVRACGYVIDACGNKCLDKYTKADANAFRDSLIARGLAGSSMTRVFGTVRAVTNFAASEQGLTYINPFAGVYYDRSLGGSDRGSIPDDSIKVVQAQCREVDDDIRWLIALVSDTGLRLAEAAGMTRSDFRVATDGTVSALIQPHAWRRLKTKGSEREIPLEGFAHWAALRIINQKSPSAFAFPRYNKEDTTNANAASAAINKWLRTYVPTGCSMHSFRHSMRDRLRAAECPADIVDQIGGWQTDGVGHSYGSGYPLEVLRKWMKAVT